jgi:NADH-quinone oxidoreductase subunit G
MPKVTINQQILEVQPGTTILKACEQLGLEIPHFCYHPKLSIAGNCRMCLVEVEKTSKPVASCSMPISEGMVIHTNSPMVEKARQGILELLLINHPLDCPICDQGGECDLQDLALNYGPDHSRFDLEKRAVQDKYLGPLIKTVMTRCIHCTRCIRFADEIAGVPELVALGRGETMEISNSLGQAIQSELSGNMIDICPVGALTHKPYAFKGRSWEWKKTAAIDVMDALGSHIEIQSRDREVVRIMPRLKEDINEEWLSDRSRFAYDGLKYQRLDQPYIRIKGKLQPCSWETAFEVIRQQLAPLKGSQIAALAGDLVDCESMLALKNLWQALGNSHLDCRQDMTGLPYTHRSHYICNTTLAGFENADCVLLVGTDPRLEAPLLNARFRKSFLKNHTPFGLVGEAVDLTYPYHHISDSAEGFAVLLQDEHPFSQILANAKRPALVLGQSLFNLQNIPVILHVIQKLIDRYAFIQEDWNGYNVLHTDAALVGGIDVGFVPSQNGYNTDQIITACQQEEIKLVYLLGVDKILLTQFRNAFTIYQGHHGDIAAADADVILPGCAYTEKTATYVNTEGRAQRSLQAVPPPGEAKEDWKIITALSYALKAKLNSLHQKPLSYISLEDIQQDLANCHPAFQHLFDIVKTPWQPFPHYASGTLSQEPLSSTIDNFYMTNTICRHSPTMAACVREIVQGYSPLLKNDVHL